MPSRSVERPVNDMATTDTGRSANEDLVRTIPGRIMTDGDTDHIYEVFAEEFVEHNPTLGEIHGPDGFREYLYEPFHAAFPDLTADVEECVAEGDRVAIRVTLGGTHEGEFMGVEPTGERFEIQAMGFFHVTDGLVTERRLQPDVYGMLQQLGVVEAPPE